MKTILTTFNKTDVAESSGSSLSSLGSIRSRKSDWDSSSFSLSAQACTIYDGCKQAWIIRHGERMDEVASQESRKWRLLIDDKRLFDPPLTSQGFIQARDRGKELLKELSQIKREQDYPKCIYCSPMERTLGTAYEIAVVTKLPIIVVPGLSACAAAVKRGGLIKKRVIKHGKIQKKEMKIQESLGEIIWVDTHKKIAAVGVIIQQNGYKLTKFNATKDCIEYIASHEDYTKIKGIITSSMSHEKLENGLDGFEMIDKIFTGVWSTEKAKYPVTACYGWPLLKEESDKYDIDVFVDNQGEPLKRVQNEIIEVIQSKFEDNESENGKDENKDNVEQKMKDDMDDYELFLNDYGWIGSCNFLTKKQIIEQFGKNGVKISFDYRFIERSFSKCVSRLIKETKDNTILVVTHREGIRKLEQRLKRTKIPYCAMAKFAAIDPKNTGNLNFVYFTDD
eukprot:CAMPEP_0201566578 /NCGR_PEP_ID=MMETSP0190_2-20130828/6437_1 /ASSEMBLY_ACC=CAM_ASM_000263 /TAXON_ID=37353 /ORGANISM="Rosalina sp." /LENGTH=450 /DNA_ID=CAMNT_0047985463 /DNA_START=32 /DNA_END=1384 /DNA_ORIENTATION=+